MPARRINAGRGSLERHCLYAERGRGREKAIIVARQLDHFTSPADELHCREVQRIQGSHGDWKRDQRARQRLFVHFGQIDATQESRRPLPLRCCQPARGKSVPHLVNQQPARAQILVPQTLGRGFGFGKQIRSTTELSI